MTRALVVDASAAVDALRAAEHSSELANVLFAPQTPLHAPALIDSEVLSAVRRAELAGSVAPESAKQRLEAFADLSLQRHGLPPFRTAVWSMRHGLHIGDAYYVALTKVLEATTTDDKLGRALRERGTVPVLTPGE